MEFSEKNADTRSEERVAIKSKGSGEISKAFIANFVHQVANPLNGVVGTLDNIVDGTYNDDTTVKKKINQSRAQVEQCIQLLRNLAYLSEYLGESTPSGALKPVRKNVKSVLPQVIIESLQFFQISADRRGIRLSLTDSATQYKVFIRPELLRQVFINIFDNWVKYGLDGASVNIEPTINARGFLVIKITGKSVSFKSGEAVEIFNFGYRSADAQAKIAQGSGIGLYICKEIITREVDGKISANHNLGSKVTTFRIAIPPEKWEI